MSDGVCRAIKGQVPTLALCLDRITELEAQLAEADRRLQLEQNRSTRIGTHGPGCHAWGPSHYECLLRDHASIEVLLGQVLKAMIYHRDQTRRIDRTDAAIAVIQARGEVQA